MRHPAKSAMLQLLRAYQWAVSPLLPPSCRYVPTCSEYAAEAVERYGAMRGIYLALGRLLRCHPFVRGGYDPVLSHHRDDIGGHEVTTMAGHQPPTAGNPHILSDRHLRKA